MSTPHSPRPAQACAQYLDTFGDDLTAQAPSAARDATRAAQPEDAAVTEGPVEPQTGSAHDDAAARAPGGPSRHPGGAAAPDNSSRTRDGWRSVRFRRWAGVVGAVGTFAIALWGAITGTVAWMDARRIDVDVNATVTVGVNDTLRAELAYVNVVNSSQRGVTLVGGVVLDDHEKRVGAVSGMVPGSPPLLNPRAALDRLQPLPLHVAADSGASVWLYWTFDDDEARTRLARSQQALLEVELRPGGRRRDAVRVPGLRPPSGSAAAEAELKGDGRGRIIGLAVRSPGNPPSTVTIATLEVWSGPGARPARVVRRPSKTATIEFPLQGLGVGVFQWAMRVDENVVATGAFTSPCRHAARAAWTVPESRCPPPSGWTPFGTAG